MQPLTNLKNKLKMPFRWLAQTKMQVDEEEPDIWKQLGIDILRKQIQLACMERQEAKQHFNKAKTDLSDILDIFLNYCSVHHQRISGQLAECQITVDQLIDELERLKQNVAKQSPQKNQSNLLTILYLALIQLSRKNNNTSTLSLNLILQFVVKFNTILPIFNPPYQDPNILHSHPSLYEKVWKRIKITHLNEQKIQKDYRRVSVLFHTTMGVLISENIYNEGMLSSIVKLPFLFIKKMINNEKEILKSLVLLHDLNIEKIQLLNLTETGKMGSMLQMTFPKIQTNQFMYIPSRGPFADNLDIFSQNKDAIPVKILYDRPLPTNANDQQIEQAFIHIHGGGFVLFSSLTTQKYTRYFANQTKMIFFSIDYKLAPKYSFAQALQDCLQVYRFLTEQVHKYLRIKLKRVFVGGDSAGGTLSCALTAVLRQERLMLPNSLFLIYPLLDSRRVFYPSRKNDFGELFLWPSFLSKCIDASLPTDKDKQNPLASPILLTEQFVGGDKGDLSFPRNWPKTFITVGAKDPFRDECILLMQKMTQAGVNCECRIFQGLKHGYTMTKEFVNQTDVALSQSAEMIKKMVKQARQ